jgi:hypothetical protein
MSSHHRILGVPANASLTQIKKAYYKKAKLIHPDVNPSPTAKEEFARLNMAYEALTNPKYIHPPVFQYKPKQKTKEQLRREWVKKRNEELRAHAIRVANARRKQRVSTNLYRNSGLFESIASLFFGLTMILPLSFVFLDVYLHPGNKPADTGTLFLFIFFLLLGLGLVSIFVVYIFNRFFK